MNLLEHTVFPRKPITDIKESDLYRSRVTHVPSTTSSEHAVSINPDAITFVYWWEDQAFKKDTARKAAELIATQQLHPIMHSNNHVRTAAKDKAKLDVAFRQNMEGKFSITTPTGLLTLRTLDDLSAQAGEILAWVARLKQHITKLEQALAQHKSEPHPLNPLPKSADSTSHLSLTRG